MPKIEYKPKKFRKDSLLLIDLVNQVIEDYESQGYSLTLRQVYYQMVARDIISNNERSYKNLGNLISDARLAGLIDWYAIEDRNRMLRGNTHWEKPSEVIRSAAASYHRDHWKGQNYYVEVWVEKDALVGVVGQICRKLDVDYFSCRGYVSQSEMWQAAIRLQNQIEQGREVVLLHLGDHDPSGKDMSRDIRDRLWLFEAGGVHFHRIALNMDQIEEYDPPPNPTKVTDSRSSGYIEKYGYSCWELDALEPSVLSDLIANHVTKYRDDEIYLKVRAEENEEIERLKYLYTHWDHFDNEIDELKKYI